MPDTLNPVLIRQITPRNVLSFGPDNTGIKLIALNLLIGPNGSGKSNLLEVVGLLRASPKELRDVTRKGGGVSEWIWKGAPGSAAFVGWIVDYPKGPKPLRHAVSFRSLSESFALEDEYVEESVPRQGEADDVYFIYRYQQGQPVVNSAKGHARKLARETIEADRSILAQRRDPEQYPELAWLAQNYERIRIYREWVFGRSAIFREPQKADLRND